MTEIIRKNELPYRKPLWSDDDASSSFKITTVLVKCTKGTIVITKFTLSRLIQYPNDKILSQ